MPRRVIDLLKYTAIEGGIEKERERKRSRRDQQIFATWVRVWDNGISVSKQLRGLRENQANAEREEREEQKAQENVKCDPFPQVSSEMEHNESTG